MTRLYTRTGDGGETGLADGARLRKDAPRIQALGSIDECNAQLGLLLAQLGADHDDLRHLLAPVQHGLFELGAGVAGAENTLTPDDIKRLEQAIDHLDDSLPPLHSAGRSRSGDPSWRRPGRAPRDDIPRALPGLAPRGGAPRGARNAAVAAGCRRGGRWLAPGA